MNEAATADQRDRSRAEAELETSLAVEAAAGTGKTRVLVTRLLNLICSGKATLGQIAAVTFTEKAAGELKIRVRTELERSLRASQDPAERERLERALGDLGHAEIGTIHSLCASLLRERPVEAGVDPQFQVADELAASLLRERVWKEWLEAELAAGNQALVRAAALGVALEGRGHSLYATALKMLDLRDLLDGRPTFDGPPPDARAFAAAARSKVEELVRLVEANCGDGGAFLDKVRLARYGLLVAEKSERHGAEACVAHLNAGGRFPGRRHWSDAAARSAAEAIHEELKEDHAKLKERLGEEVVAGACEALCGFVDAYRRAKAEKGILDFHDLLLVTRDMLARDRAAREHFKERFRYILVDEFQDTDPLQVEIVFFLAERPGRHATDWQRVELEAGKLFVVGDPKQSIYRFRRADIEVYQRAKAAVARQGATLTLSESFRPVRAIADAVNAIFAPIIARPDDGDYQPDYVPLDPHRSEEPSRPPVVLLYPPPQVRREAGNQRAMRRAEARCVAAMVRRIVEEERWEVFEVGERTPRPARYSDIAVLLPRFTDAEVYSQAMLALGIPLRMVGGKRFFVTHEVHSLVALLRAIDNPHDGVALVAALRGPFFGVSDDELVAARCEVGALDYLDHEYPGALGEAMRTLRRLHGERNSMSAGLFVQRVLEETGALELLALRFQGEQRVANLLKVVERARALDAAERVTLRGFVRWLSHLNATEADEQESPAAEADENFVQLLTIHKAKGLQFPIVFLADISSGGVARGNVVVMRESGQFAVKLTGDYASSNYPDKSYEDKREEAERKRLFYVGATRARDYLLLLSGWSSGKCSGLAKFLGDWAAPGQPPWGEQAPLGYVLDTRRLDLAGTAPRPFRVEVPTDGAVAGAARERLRAREGWRGELARALAEAGRGVVAKAPSHLEEGFAPPDEEVRARAEVATHIGMLVHVGIERAAVETRERVERLLAAQARRLGLDAEAVGRARELLAAALDSDLLRRAAQAEARYHEVPFALKLDGVVLTGAMDLLFVEQGRVVVADFKTDAVGPEEVERRAAVYRRQMLSYALAARRLLCKPVAEVIIFFIGAGRSWAVPFTEEELERAAAELLRAE